MTWEEAQKLHDKTGALITRPSWRRGWYVGRNEGQASCIIDHKCGGMEFAYRKEDREADDYEPLELA